jgi:PAS domain S-box-containing protein
MDNRKQPSILQSFRIFSLTVVCGWTIILTISLAWNYFLHETELGEVARISARAGFEKDVLFRAWNAQHGGVYVPATEETPPNPYLDERVVPERDIITPSGKKLTLMNPAYMTRQVHELGRLRGSLWGHITSLKPIRPENAADQWETRALQEFERGAKEVSSIETVGGEEFLRLMRPLIAEKPCLKCHADQGYKENDVRGGISISIPMAPLKTAASLPVRALFGAHLILWLLGIVGFLLGGNRFSQQIALRQQTEEALRESEEKFRTVFESANDAIFVVDQKTTRFLDANEEGMARLGYSREEFLSMTTFDIASPRTNNPPEKRLKILEKINTDGHAIFENVHLRKDGTDMPVEINSTVIDYKGGKAIHSVVRDITERKRMEEQVRESHQQVGMLLNSTGEGIFGTDKNGICTLCNPACARLLGYDGVDQLIGKPMHALTHHSHADGSHYPRDECRMLEALRDGQQVHVSDEVFWRRDGTSFPAEYWAYPTERNGDVIGTVVSFVDITEREQAGKMLHAVLDTSPVALGITSVSDGTFRYVNPAAGRLLAISANDLVGKQARDLYANPDDRKTLLERIATEGRVLEFEAPLKRFDGEHIWVSFSAELSNLDDEKVLIAAFVDVTRRRRAEIDAREAKKQAEFANRSKTEFLANMSHELRTPLTIISGASEMLTMEMFGTIGNPKYLEYAKNIQDAGEHLLGVVKDLLDISQIEMGRFELNEGNLDVEEVLSACHKLMNGRASELGLELGLEFTKGLPTLRADELRIKQVVLNLLSNALKFTPKGGTVTLRAGADGEGCVALAVADTGVGIDPSDIDKAMIDLGRAGDPYKRDVQGAGLGLPLSKRLTELHGGTLEIESEPGVGTTVTVRFPLERGIR